MTEKDVVRKCMTMRGWSQVELAKRAGFPSQSNITGLLNNNKNGIRMDNFHKMINAMGFEIVIRDIMGGEEVNVTEFIVDMKEEKA